MDFRASWVVSIEENTNPPEKDFFGRIKTRAVQKKKSGWIVGVTNVAKDVEGVTYSTKNYVAVLPDGENKLVFLASDKVTVEAMSAR